MKHCAADGVIVTEAAQFKDFEGRVRPGGTMIVEKAALQAETERKSIRVVKIPAFETAISLSGASLGANLILLGAFVMVSQIISPGLTKQRVKEVFVGREKVLKGNLDAFDEGSNLVNNF
jgi:Pyruvate/2-oxoacid:ferredoxin oxidoreductase gamma subunit